MYLVNDAKLMRGQRISLLNNLLLTFTLIISLIIGLKNLVSSLENILQQNLSENSLILPVLTLVSIIFTIGFQIFLYRKNARRKL